MKLAIFGGTGRTGKHLVRQALEAGYTISVLVRDPGKLGSQDDRLHIIKGDITELQCVEEAIREADAVISVLGPTENKPDFKVTHGTRNILNVMKKFGVQRLIVSAGAGVGDPADAPNLMNRLINILLKLLSRHVYEDMVQTVDIIRKSDVDWTIVRVPMLVDDPATGKVRIAYVGKGMGMRITREDMAAFMLEQVNTTTYLRQAPAISNE